MAFPPKPRESKMVPKKKEKNEKAEIKLDAKFVFIYGFGKFFIGTKFYYALKRYINIFLR